MALFGKRAELQEVTFPVTAMEGDKENPPIVVWMRAIPDRHYQQLASEWIDRPDRKDFTKISFNGKKIGELYADNIVLFDGDLVRMTGMTIGNQVRLIQQMQISDEDRKRFYAAGEEGVRLTRQEFIGLCEWCPASFAVPMLNEYKETLD